MDSYNFDLPIPSFSHPRDDYGTDFVPPYPLLVDRIMDDQQLESAPPIFRLPLEVLGIILSYVESSSLRSLALVNSACRQLARSRQFVSVCFDHKLSTTSLLPILVKEMDGTIGCKAIGPFIRRIKVKFNHLEYKESQRNVGLSSDESDSSFEEQMEIFNGRRLEAPAPEDSYSRYLRHLMTILSTQAALPRLDLLDWQDITSIQQPFFAALTTSSLRHLRLLHTPVDEEFEVLLPAAADRWNLQTLDMDIRWDASCDEGGTTWPICASMLRSCSHSLETLFWHGLMIYPGLSGASPSNIPRFERLQNLRLALPVLDRHTLDVLLEPYLRTLDLRNSSLGDGTVGDALRARGQIQSLHTLVLKVSNISIDNCLEFVKINNHISKLTLLGDYDPSPGDSCNAQFETRFLPVVWTFETLRSLRLCWPAAVTYIPESGLRIISGMTTIEQLCLGTGRPNGNWGDWLVDHDRMRGHLSLLPRLKNLAFTWDSYQSREYYMLRMPSRREIENARLIGGTSQELLQLWEDRHKLRMTSEIERYAISIRELKWVFLGQYPMAVERHPVGNGFLIVPLCNERDPSDTLLNRMFGWDGVEGGVGI